MKHAGMQPYFFPYLGYFNLMNLADHWIFYDVSQFTRKWIPRNRILNPGSGWQYIVVPVKKHTHTTPINQIEIANQIDWITKIFRQLHCYKNEAPYYSEVIAFLEKCFADAEANLARFNIKTICKICDLLGIETPTHVFSGMNLVIEPCNTPEDKVIRICQAIGAEELVGAQGGASLYDVEKFSAHGIKLSFQCFKNMVYECGKYQFEPALSIIDVLMWNSRRKIKEHMDKFR